MNIFEVLRLDHLRLRDGLDDLIELTSRDSGNTNNDDTWAEAFFEFKQSLNAHDRAEEAVFYEALTRVPNRQELADIKTDEHHQVEETLQELELINPVTPGWHEVLALLKNQFDSHVAEEETFVFGLLQRVLADEESEQMGREFLEACGRERTGNGYRLGKRNTDHRVIPLRR